MAQDVTLTMDGLLLNWLKNVGDSVKAGEIIAEFEADKATVEVEAPADGVLAATLVEVGDEVKEGTAIARIGAAGESGNGAAKASAPAQAEPEAKTESKPEASTEIDEAAAPAEQATGENGNGATAARTPDGRIMASPLAKRIAEDKGIDLAQVAGSGPGGRITKVDVETFKPGTSAKPAASAAPASAPADNGALSMAFQSYGKLPEGDNVEILDMSRMRKAIVKGTVTSFNTTPHFYVTMEVDVAELLKLRQNLNKQLEAEGIKITVNDMVVKAAALTLKQFRNLNSHYYGDKIVKHKRINVAIAVSLPNNGLVNVVSPDADKTSLSTMAQYHAQMFADAREGKIKPEYIKEGTFLVSNLGAYGVESFSAIIDPPQSGALAVGAAQMTPIVLSDGTLGVGNRMKVTLSVDHRISDGAEGAQFLQHFKGLIENPMRLLV
jgi:pyruvate dehydrogenase E2 component (dihydrolipoamide acetyltransferase)